MVDWAGGAAGPDYYQAHSNVQTVGEITARFIYSTRINPMQVHCIGHSLGAHACGYVGRNVKLGRISGLDPAGPLFDDNNRLRDTDAEFVSLISTFTSSQVSIILFKYNFYFVSYVDIIHTDMLAGLQFVFI
jgi:hypothetical protein